MIWSASRAGLRRSRGSAAAQQTSGLLLDVLAANVTGAYALRQLRGAYTGPAVRVRRAVDNAETNVGFASGVLDTAALTAFCGSSSGFVAKWFDQSASGQDMAQVVASQQPQIVASGVVIPLGNAKARPTIRLTGVNQVCLSNASFAVGGNAVALCSVVSRVSVPANDYSRLAGFTPPGSRDNQAGGAVFGYLHEGVLKGYASSDKAQCSIGTAPAQIISVFSGSAHSMTADGVTGSPVAATDAFSASGTMMLGNGDDMVRGWDGAFAEHLVVIGALSAADQATIRSNQRDFYGTP